MSFKYEKVQKDNGGVSREFNFTGWAAWAFLGTVFVLGVLTGAVVCQP